MAQSGHESHKRKYSRQRYPDSVAECEHERDLLYTARWQFQQRVGLRAMYANPELKAQSDDMLRRTHLLTAAIARRNKHQIRYALANGDNEILY